MNVLAGIYLHIPYCKQACHYCDFHFKVGNRDVNRMVQCLNKELILRNDYLADATVKTVYFGGGTPSLMNISEVVTLLNCITNSFDTRIEEVTFELNPDDSNAKYLEGLLQSGVTRLSIGMQTFHNDFLTYMNRAHDASQNQKSFQSAREVGFPNISVDLIFGMPGSTLQQVASDLESVLDLDPEHISTYHLSIEPKTAFGVWKDQGKLTPLEDQAAADQYQMIMDQLTIAGYQHYEISNFCKPGYRGLHNSGYWNLLPYLGIGPSAHSFYGNSRQFNIANNNQYMDSIESDRIPCTIEKLTLVDQVNEYILTSLRTREGCNLDLIRDQFRVDLKTEKAETIRFLESKMFIITNSDKIILSEKGKLIADNICSELFIS